MPEQNTPKVWLLGWPTHRDYDGGVNDPLPKRWVDLIHRLNERDRQAREQSSLRRGAGGQPRAGGHDSPK
jgi:hypothetical protein